MSGEAPGLRVIQVQYGERVTQKSIVLHEYAQYGQPDGDLQMDYNFWVMRAPDATILLDTGYDIAARDWLGEISVVPTPDGLGLLGIDPASVDMVITSHFHYDHIGYLRLFTNAQVVSGQAEYDYWFGKWHDDALDGEFTIAEHLEAVKRAEDEGRLRLISAETEVYPGITVYGGRALPRRTADPGPVGQRAEDPGRRRGPLLRADRERVAVLRVHFADRDEGGTRLHQQAGRRDRRRGHPGPRRPGPGQAPSARGAGQPHRHDPGIREPRWDRPSVN